MQNITNPHHSFDIRLAAETFGTSKMVGVENAVFLQDIAYWIDYNRSSNINFYDGKYWTYATMDALLERHPYWTKKQLRRVINNCKENGWLIISNYNKNVYDRTNWYTVSDQIMEFLGFVYIGFDTKNNHKNSQTEIPKCPNGLLTNAQMGTPIPNTIPYTENKNNIYIDQPRTDSPTLEKPTQVCQTAKIQKPRIFNEELFNSFWRSYPKKVSKEAAIKAWNKIKPDEQLYQIIIDAVEKQKKTQQWQNKQYIPNPATWLNGKKWEDEIDEPAQQEPQKQKPSWQKPDINFREDDITTWWN